MIDDLLARCPALAALRDVPVVVACSGGADSLALLALTTASGAIAHAVYVDHGLRDDTARDLAAVEQAAQQLGAASCHRETVDVAGDGNIEARARAARYAALECVRERVAAHAVLVGHTMDDQAETVLLAVLRGSASKGLGGMPAERDHIVRPLLALRRHETAALCAHLGLSPADDTMNAELRFRRAWIRHELLPAMSARAERDLVPVLARQAAVLRSESDYLDRVAAEALAAAGDPPSSRALAALDPVLARRAIRLLLGQPPVSLAQVDAVLAVINNHCQATEVTGGREVRRSSGRIVVRSTTVPLPNAVVPESRAHE